MATIELLALDRTAWEQVAEAPAVFAAERGLTLGAEPDLLRAVASTRILEKLGFEQVGEISDQEDGLTWRWDREPTCDR